MPSYINIYSHRTAGFAPILLDLSVAFDTVDHSKLSRITIWIGRHYIAVVLVISHFQTTVPTHQSSSLIYFRLEVWCPARSWDLLFYADDFRMMNDFSVSHESRNTAKNNMENFISEVIMWMDANTKRWKNWSYYSWPYHLTKRVSAWAYKHKTVCHQLPTVKKTLVLLLILTLTLISKYAKFIISILGILKPSVISWHMMLPLF